MSLNLWKGPQEFESFVAGGGTGFLFKHSTRCSISAAARGEVERFVEGHPDVQAFEILVIENRPTSDAVAGSLGVPHASPQVIFLHRGQAVWSATHWDIDVDRLEKAWKEHAEVKP